MYQYRQAIIIIIAKPVTYQIAPRNPELRHCCPFLSG